MKIIRLLCLLTVSAILFCGCADVTDVQLPNNTSSVENKSGDSPESGSDATSFTGTETADLSSEGPDIEFGRIYTAQEFQPIFQKITSENTKRLQTLNERFDEDLSGGKIPQTLSFDYNSEKYELSLNCSSYSHAECPRVEYRDAVNKISVTADVETLGTHYFYSVTSAFSCTFTVSNLEKKTEEELTRIADEFFSPFFGARQIGKDEYTVVFEQADYENKHTDASAKVYMVRYLYNNVHSLNSTLAYLFVDEYGFITTAMFNPDQYYLDSEFMSKLPDIDYDKIMSEIEKYREPACDCALSARTQLVRRLIDGAEVAHLMITIVPDENGSAGHIHDYHNNELSIIYKLK